MEYLQRYENGGVRRNCQEQFRTAEKAGPQGEGKDARVISSNAPYSLTKDLQVSVGLCTAIYKIMRQTQQSDCGHDYVVVF